MIDSRLGSLSDSLKKRQRLSPTSPLASEQKLRRHSSPRPYACHTLSQSAPRACESKKIITRNPRCIKRVTMALRMPQSSVLYVFLRPCRPLHCLAGPADQSDRFRLIPRFEPEKNGHLESSTKGTPVLCQVVGRWMADQRANAAISLAES